MMLLLSTLGLLFSSHLIILIVVKHIVLIYIAPYHQLPLYMMFGLVSLPFGVGQQQQIIAAERVGPCPRRLEPCAVLGVFLQ